MSEVVITGGDVVLVDGTVAQLDVVCRDGVIVELAPYSPTDIRDAGDPAGDQSDWPERIDATGRLVSAGFIDLQINGAFGHDFTSDATSIGAVASRLPRFGVTSFLPTVVTAPTLARRRALDAIRTPVEPAAAAPLGLHFEGPAISTDRPGAHDPSFIGLPTVDEIAGWSNDAGVAMVTLAPETAGAFDVIARLYEAGVVVAIGHTRCSAAEFSAARLAGAGYVTHLFNAMAPFSHRDPGPIGAALADDSVTAGLICDLIHVDPVAIRMAWNVLGPTRTNLVTDAVAALGLDASATELGGRRVTVGPDGVRTPDGVLAGSNLSLDQAVRNLVAVTGCAPAEALATVTTVPANLLDLADRGRIEVGARADLVVLDSELRPQHTVIGGHTAWRS